MSAEKPRYRVKARRLGEVVQMGAAPNPYTMAAIREFAEHIERENATAVAMVAIGRDGSCMTRYDHNWNFYALLGGVDRLRQRMHQEFDVA